MSGYALGGGWGRGKDQGLNAVGHSGGQQGTSTYIMLDPEHQAGVVILINLEEADAAEIAVEVMKIVLGVGAGSGK